MGTFDAELARLTPRVAQVLRMLLDRQHPKDVAKELGLRVGAIYSSRALACRALGVDSPAIKALPHWRRTGLSKAGPRLGPPPDPRKVTLFTTTDAGHRHVAIFDDWGTGRTDAGPDGHVHRIHELELAQAAGHLHQLSDERAP